MLSGPVRVLEGRHVGKRNQPPSVAGHEELAQRRRVELRARHGLHHHPVLVRRRVDRGDLLLVVRVRERVLDGRRRDAELQRALRGRSAPSGSGCGSAGREVTPLSIGSACSWKSSFAASEYSVVDVAPAERELVQRLRRAARRCGWPAGSRRTRTVPGCPDMRRVSSAPSASADGRWPSGLSVTFSWPWFVEPPNAARRRRERRDVRVLLEARHRDLLQAHHLRERRALRRLGRAVQRAGVVGRKESLGDDLPEARGQHEDHEREREHQRPAVHHPREAALVRVQRAPRRSPR